MKTPSKSISEIAATGGLWPWLKRNWRKAALAGCIASMVAGVPAQAESLWLKKTNNERSMFADRRANGIGDIVTVVVTETSSQSASRDTSTTKDAGINNAVTQFLFPTSASGFGTHNGALPGTDISGSNTYNGGGEITNNSALSGRAAVMVIDKLPNGNLVIEGARIITFSGETTFAVIRGFIRPEDISRDNTVLSSNIADARVQFISEGSLTDAQRKGWLLKLNDILNPF